MINLLQTHMKPIIFEVELPIFLPIFASNNENPILALLMIYCFTVPPPVVVPT